MDSHLTPASKIIRIECDTPEKSEMSICAVGLFISILVYLAVGIYDGRKIKRQIRFGAV